VPGATRGIRGEQARRQQQKHLYRLQLLLASSVCLAFSSAAAAIFEGKTYTPTRSVATGHRTPPGRVWARPIWVCLAGSSSFFFSGFFFWFLFLFFLFSVLFIFFRFKNFNF
jgi:hypothetical protein